MARGRMVSKDISLDEKVDALSDDTARLLFTWLIPHLDREGRMYGDAQIFKSIVAPRRNYSTKKVEKSLEQMEKLGLVVRYSVNGNQYLLAPNFEKHQIGLRKDKESPSKIPPYNPDQRRSKDGVRTKKVTPKLKRSLSLREENIYIAYPEFPNVNKMTKEEHEKLIDKFGEAGTRDRVEELSLYIASQNVTKYKNHYATILAWEKRRLKGGQDGAHRKKPRPLIDRQTYTRPEDLP